MGTPQHKTIPYIEVDTGYEGMNKIMQLLYANAETLPTQQGG